MSSERVRRIRGGELDLSTLALNEFLSAKDADARLGQVGDISTEGKNQIAKLIIEKGFYPVPVVDQEHLKWNVREATSFSKRLALYYSRQYPASKYVAYKPLTSDILATIGQIADRYTVKETGIKIRFIKAPFKGEIIMPGFGHNGGSCWFTKAHAPMGYTNMLELFEKLGGWAILFYDGEIKENKGFARLWAWQYTDDAFVVFNGYYRGSKNTKRLVEILTGVLNCKSSQFVIFPDPNKGNLHINEAGYLLYPREIEGVMPASGYVGSRIKSLQK